MSGSMSGGTSAVMRGLVLGDCPMILGIITSAAMQGLVLPAASLQQDRNTRQVKDNRIFLKAVSPSAHTNTPHGYETSSRHGSSSMSHMYYARVTLRAAVTRSLSSSAKAR